jgi:hypothetical protein
MKCKNEKRTAVGYYRMRPSFKAKIKSMAKKMEVSEAEVLDKLLVMCFSTGK